LDSVNKKLKQRNYNLITEEVKLTEVWKEMKS
jgi:hypothetical protein